MKGIAVSPGVAIGTAYCIDDVFVRPEKQKIASSQVSQEWNKFESAREHALTDLKALERKVASQVGKEEAAIFAVHQSVLKDSSFNSKMRTAIVEEQLSASAALHRLLEEYTVLFGRSGDSYLSERLNDIRDVVLRVSAYTSEVVEKQKDVLPGPLIVVANELLPSQVVALGDVSVNGIVTQAGSQTSHAAIIARSRGIPAISGVVGILSQVKTGDTIVVDGRNGHIDVNPDPETLSAFRKLEREFFDLKGRLAENRDLPALTKDGTELKLQANINGIEDAKAATAMGANGVGLFRTEYLYLTHPDVPDEEEQVEYYRKVIESSPDNLVNIRTLDIGGDKTIPYLGHRHQEANPFMGWRSIRLSFEHLHLFTAQIRAVLRAAAGFPPGSVRLMFPMVTTIEEVKKVWTIVQRSIANLKTQGLPYGEVPIGIMLEVPAAAIVIDSFMKHVDFVSVGSNDLVQYLMAADRDNPKVSHLCQPLAPAVLRVLRHVILTCNKSNKSITVCGEMAGQPKAFLLLLGLGLRNFSMSPAFVPSIKQLASQISIDEAKQIVQQAFRFKTTRGVNRFLASQIERIAPALQMLDTNS